MNLALNASATSQKTRRKLHRKIFERKHLVNLVNQISLKHKLHYYSYTYSKLARTLLPVESTTNKSSNISPQSYRRRMHLGRNVSYEYQLNQSVSAKAVGRSSKCIGKNLARRIQKNLRSINWYSCRKSSKNGKFHTFLVSFMILLSRPE